jgi:hypothetical protein
MVDDRPAWARRMLSERQARGWSQADAIKAMRAHAPVDPRTHVQVELPSTSSLLRQYKRWEAGEVEPDRGKSRSVLQADHRQDVRHGDPCDVPGRAQA